MRNVGVVRVDLEWLGGLLHLPEGHRITAARQPDGFMDAVDLLVEGPDIPNVPSCNIPPRVQLIFTTVETEVLVRERTTHGSFA